MGLVTKRWSRTILNEGWGGEGRKGLGEGLVKVQGWRGVKRGGEGGSFGFVCLFWSRAGMPVGLKVLCCDVSVKNCLAWRLGIGQAVHPTSSQYFTGRRLE